jgi:hypothetical protein
MEIDVEIDREPLSTKGIVMLILLPLFTNISILLFEIFSLSIWVSSSDPSNIIGVIGIYFYYLGCLALFVAYGRSTGGWTQMFGGQVMALVIVLVITYPIFYLFWLPLIIYQLLLYVGTPKSVWERMFSETSMSVELLHPEFSYSSCQRFGRIIYIGIPFAFFALAFIVFVVVLTPLWYFILSPMGLGTLGICLHISLHFPHTIETDLLERIAKSYDWGVFIHTYALALPFAVIAIAYLVIVGVRWFAVMLAVLTLLHFVVCCVPAAITAVRKCRRNVVEESP